jgi:hypothetical protein
VKWSKAKPAEDGSPRMDLAVPAFGYKNHVGIDRRHGLIRTWSVTDAARHGLGIGLRGGSRGTLQERAPPSDARFQCRTVAGRRSQVFVIPEQERCAASRYKAAHCSTVDVEASRPKGPTM